MGLRLCKLEHGALGVTRAMRAMDRIDPRLQGTNGATLRRSGLLVCALAHGAPGFHGAAAAAPCGSFNWGDVVEWSLACPGIGMDCERCFGVKSELAVVVVAPACVVGMAGLTSPKVGTVGLPAGLTDIPCAAVGARLSSEQPAEKTDTSKMSSQAQRAIG